MQREQVIGILHFFRDADKLVKAQISEIEVLERKYYDSAGAVKVDALPGGKGRPSNPSEQMAIKAICRGVGEEIDLLRRKIDEITRVKLAIRQEIDALPYPQRTAIMQFYVAGDCWHKIARQLNYSDRQCKNFRSQALQTLANRFSTNRLISQYKFPKL